MGECGRVFPGEWPFVGWILSNWLSYGRSCPKWKGVLTALRDTNNIVFRGELKTFQPRGARFMDMILSPGELVLISHRRLFSEDVPRFFIGEVEAYSAGIARVTGHSWLREAVRGDIQRKPDRRTKIVSLASGALLIYVLPRDLNLGALQMRQGKGQEVVLVDDAGFEMDLTDRRHAVARL